MEAVGVPMATWPLGADQFYNEMLTQVLGVGVKVGMESWTQLGGGEEAEMRRKKAKELSIKSEKNRISKYAVQFRWI
ncbi:hypothetical protein Dsin_000336 [Dipteronia sinensis]|uniref:Uncharacterized protein n=1 Tax=Dipteronia sinensis TaxID=43782 RepID=A0AAE0B389_9ROSI|nr:hypothetical protein Dsin_000336 [Dipteronia sinensis]